MKKLVPERNFLKENRKLDKLNDSLFLQNCELKRNENKNKKYIELLQNKNIDAVIEKDRIKKENDTLKKAIEEYEKLLEELKNNLNKTVKICTKDKIKMEEKIILLEKIVDDYKIREKIIVIKNKILENKKNHYKTNSYLAIGFTFLLTTLIIVGALKWYQNTFNQF